MKKNEVSKIETYLIQKLILAIHCRDNNNQDDLNRLSYLCEKICEQMEIDKECYDVIEATLSLYRITHIKNV